MKTTYLGPKGTGQMIQNHSKTNGGPLGELFLLLQQRWGSVFPKVCFNSRMAQTNLILKILLCLLVPAYHTMQANIGSNNGLSALRYWLALSFVFLTELFMDQLNLSPGFTIIKLGFMFWCVAPLDYNMGAALSLKR